MTPLVKSLVSLAEEAAEYIWFDMGTLARYSIDWKRTQPNWLRNIFGWQKRRWRNPARIFFESRRKRN